MNEKVKKILDSKLRYFEVSDATKGEITREICQLKDAECQKRVEKIFKEMEAHEIATLKELNIIQVIMCREDYQALKKKEGIK